jgi:8-oxo-dGTP pyrophosphatase MutT (NUDIX family)
MMRDRTGDGFIRCSDGHVRWGLFGAAGVVFVITEADGPKVMLQKRSAFAHEGGTWSCAGGALGMGEAPLVGALREAAEEVGTIPEEYEVIGSVVFAPCEEWHYTTLVVGVGHRFGDSVNFETDAVQWFTPDQVEDLELHAGFAAAWPELRAVIEQRRDGDASTPPPMAPT